MPAGRAGRDASGRFAKLAQGAPSTDPPGQPSDPSEDDLGNSSPTSMPVQQQQGDSGEEDNRVEMDQEGTQTVKSEDSGQVSDIASHYSCLTTV